ncbi:HIT-like protein HI_0961, partial [Dysosmobacter welbionis]
MPVGVWYTLFKRAVGRPGSRCREPRRSSGADRKDAYDGILWISAAAGPGTGAGAVCRHAERPAAGRAHTGGICGRSYSGEPESAAADVGADRASAPRPGDAPLRLLSQRRQEP